MYNVPDLKKKMYCVLRNQNVNVIFFYIIFLKKEKYMP